MKGISWILQNGYPGADGQNGEYIKSAISYEPGKPCRRLFLIPSPPEDESEDTDTEDNNDMESEGLTNEEAGLE